MSVIDMYLKKVEASKRKELERIRTFAHDIIPDAEEVISYGIPTLKYRGKPFLGFDAHEQHIGLYPFSGRVVESLADDLRDYKTSKGAIRVPLDEPIRKSLLRKIIACRVKAIRDELGAGRS